MRCPSADSLFLRANGNLVCWDAAGSDLILAEYDPCRDLRTRLALEGPYERIASELRAQRLPFPDVCTGCLCLSFDDSPVRTGGVINVVQVESSSRCTLRCRACASTEERDRLRPPLDLPIPVFRKFLEDLRTSGIDVGTFDFSGHGEPSQNPETWDLVRTARILHPGSYISLITNAQMEFDPGMVESGLDRIQFSVDGVDPASYGEYRVHGDFNKALRLIGGFSEYARSTGAPIRLVWSYILFEHNDSLDHLARLWETASALGVHEIRFVFTHLGRWSREIPSAWELRRKLKRIGVPSANQRLDSIESLVLRRRLAQLMKHSSMIYRSGQKAWRRARSVNLRPGFPIVTADYCRIRSSDLRKALAMATSLHHQGRTEDSRSLLKHVEKSAQIPARHNPSYDPKEMLAPLGRPYQDLRDALGGLEASGLEEKR